MSVSRRGNQEWKIAVAKGQKKSNREAKKPKKTDAERVKDSMGGTGLAIPRMGERVLPKKS